MADETRHIPPYIPEPDEQGRLRIPGVYQREGAISAYEPTMSERFYDWGHDFGRLIGAPIPHNVGNFTQEAWKMSPPGLLYEGGRSFAKGEPVKGTIETGLGAFGLPPLYGPVRRGLDQGMATALDRFYPPDVLRPPEFFPGRTVLEAGDPWAATTNSQRPAIQGAIADAMKTNRQAAAGMRMPEDPWQKQLLDDVEKRAMRNERRRIGATEADKMAEQLQGQYHELVLPGRIANDAKAPLPGIRIDEANPWERLADIDKRIANAHHQTMVESKLPGNESKLWTDLPSGKAWSALETEKLQLESEIRAIRQRQFQDFYGRWRQDPNSAPLPPPYRGGSLKETEENWNRYLNQELPPYIKRGTRMATRGGEPVPPQELPPLPKLPDERFQINPDMSDFEKAWSDLVAKNNKPNKLPPKLEVIEGGAGKPAAPQKAVGDGNAPSRGGDWRNHIDELTKREELLGGLPSNNLERRTWRQHQDEMHQILDAFESSGSPKNWPKLNTDFTWRHAQKWYGGDREKWLRDYKKATGKDFKFEPFQDPDA